MSDLQTLEARVDKLERIGIPGLRDFLATSALAVLAKQGYTEVNALARYAYAVADAMVEERKKYDTPIE